MEKFIYYSIFFIIVLMLIENKKEKFTNNKDICRGKLTDHEYIDHMIPHHQVAIDISIMLRKKTRDPVMLEILRKLIWTQKTEITIMKIMRRKLPQNVSSGISKEYTATLDFEHIIMGGDFNTIFDINLDKQGGSLENCTNEYTKELIAFMETYDLVDTIRHQYPDRRIFTRTQISN